jgi:hypothetical protein
VLAQVLSAGVPTVWALRLRLEHVSRGLGQQRREDSRWALDRGEACCTTTVLVSCTGMRERSRCAEEAEQLPRLCAAPLPDHPAERVHARANSRPLRSAAHRRSERRMHRCSVARVGNASGSLPGPTSAELPQESGVRGIGGIAAVAGGPATLRRRYSSALPTATLGADELEGVQLVDHLDARNRAPPSVCWRAAAVGGGRAAGAIRRLGHEGGRAVPRITLTFR